MNAAALWRQALALKPRPRALTKEWGDAKAAGADVATPPPTVFEFGGGGTSKNNGNGVDNLRENYVLGVGAKRNGDDVRVVSKHGDFLIKFVEQKQKFGTKELGYEVIHRAAGHKMAQTEAHKVREAKKREDHNNI
jgi:hypothetical protein